MAYSHLASPVVRTNPVTGYKSLFVNKGFTTRILELHPEESDLLLDYLFRHISENHDLQVRYKWSANDVAIWDNRSTFHTATYVTCCLGSAVAQLSILIRRWCLQKRLWRTPPGQPRRRHRREAVPRPYVSVKTC